MLAVPVIALKFCLEVDWRVMRRVVVGELMGWSKLSADMQHLGLLQGFLVIFDRRSQAPEWALRMRTEAAQITWCKDAGAAGVRQMLC